MDPINRVGAYEVLQLIGEGSMTRVFVFASLRATGGSR